MERRQEEIDLRICTYNVNSIRKKIDVIREILKSCDVFLCQETILLDEDDNFLNLIDKDFCVYSRFSSLSHNGDGRPIGGMAIFLRRELNLGVCIREMCENYMIARVTVRECSFNLLNIYMPCDTGTVQSLGDYQQVLGALQLSIDSLDDCPIVCAGDFNAGPSRGRFWPYLLFRLFGRSRF